ncbi:T9SS type A sorting domain-containing protein [Ekhidna sp.]
MRQLRYLTTFLLTLLLSHEGIGQTFDFVTTAGSGTPTVTSTVSGITLTATISNGANVDGALGGPAGNALGPSSTTIPNTETLDISFSAPVDISGILFSEFAILANGDNYVLTPSTGTPIVLQDNGAELGGDNFEDLSPGDWLGVTSITVSYSGAVAFRPGLDNIDFTIPLPTYTVTWLDDGDGDIDQAQIDFNTPISVTDNTPADAFDVFAFTGGITVDNVVGFGASDDFSTISGVSQIVLNVSGVTGTSSPATTITYNQSSDEEIRSDASSTEIVDTENPTAIIDGAAPLLLSAVTNDNDGNGQIDQIIVTYSETMEADDIDEVATVDPGDDFTDDFIVTGYDIASVAPLSGSGVDDDEIVITLVESGAPDTDAVPNLAITVGELGDLATVANTNAASSAAVDDGANPVIVSAVTGDIGGVAGQIDQITVTFSEAIEADDVDEVATVDPGDDFTDDFTIAGYDITGVLPTGGSGVDGNQLIISLAESGGNDTGAVPNVTLNASQLNDLVTPTPNAATAYSAAATDGVAPLLLSAVTNDNDGNGQIDQIIVTYSETMEADDIDGTPTVVGGDDFTDDFVVTGYDIASVATVAGGSTDDDEILITLTESGSSDTDAVPNLAITVGELGDLATVANTNAASSAAVTDGANPVIVSAVTADVGGVAGQIDQITLTFSEDIDGAGTLDTDGGSDDFIVTDGGYTYTITSVAFNSPDGATITLTERGSPDTGITPDINLGIGDVEDLAPADNSLTVAQDFTTTTDGAAPVLYDFSLQATNSFIQVVYSEPIQQVGGGTPVQGDFNENQANVTPTTTITINSITDFLGNPLTGAEDTIQFTLSVGPVPSTYDAGDNVVIDTDGSTLEDAAGNALGDAQSTGNVQVNDVNNVVTIVGATWVTTSAAPNFEGYIELEFSDGVYGENTGQSIRLAHSVDGIYEQGDWTDGDSDCVGDDQLCGTYVANGSTVFVNTDSNNDVELRAGANGAGGAGDANDEIRFETTSGGNIVNYTGTLHRFQLNDIDSGPWTGSETYTFGPSGAESGKINGRSTASTMVGSYTFVFTLPDLVAEDFDNATATALDTDSDGNIDAVEVVMPDGIEDATVTLGDFQFNTIVPSGFDTGTTANDNTFRLLFDSYSGTAVVGSLVYIAGDLEDDAEVNASYLPNGNAVASGSITPVDGAGPVIQSALTEDVNLNGRIDQITVTFSEAFADIDIDAGDFSLSDGYTIDVISSIASPNIILTLDESGASDTYIVPDVTIVPGGAGMLQDLSAGNAPNTAQTFNNTSDGAAPYITVNSSSGNTTPDFSGTIDDVNATVIISVDGQTRSTAPAIQNNGDGTWSYTSASDGGPITLTQGLGFYEVTVIGIDNSGNNRTDVSSSEYEVTGGASITAATPATLCESDGFQTLGQIIIDEGGDGDFSAGTDETILLTLPAGFEFDTSIPANFSASSLNDISVISSVFVGTASLQITITVTGIAGDDIVRIDDLEFKTVNGGASGNLVRAGGTASLLTNDTNYATLASNAQPSAIASLDETVTGTSDITSLTIDVGTAFSLDATDQSPTTLNWYESVVDGSPEFVGTVATQANLNTAEGLHTYFLSDNDGTCDSDPLTFNLLVYDYSDNGTNNFSSRTFRSTDDPDTMIFSNPANHIVSVSGSGIVANISESGTLKAVFDPSTVAEGTYVITYSIENQLGQVQTVVGSFTVEALSDLIQQFRRNGIVDAAPGEDYCEVDVLSFDADLAEVAGLASAYFFRFSYLKTAGPGAYTTFPIAFSQVAGASYPVDPNQSNGAGSPTNWVLTGHNPNTNWDLDLSTLDRGATYDIYLEYNRIGDGARGTRRVFSLNVEALPTVSIVNFGGLCENDNTTYQLQATVNGSTGFMTNGFDLEFFNGITFVPVTSYPDENLNPFDLQITEGGPGPGQYRVIYTSTPQGDGDCTNTDTLPFTVFPIPTNPEINTSQGAIGNGGGDPWYDATDMVNGMSTVVLEYCGDSDFNRIFADLSANPHKFYTDLAGTDEITATGNGFIDNQNFQDHGGIYDGVSGTFDFYFSRIENGCESLRRKVSVYVYDETDVPNPTTTANNEEIVVGERYVYEYCDAYTPIGLNTLVADASDPDSRNQNAYFRIYDAARSPIGIINSSSLAAADFGGVAAAGVTKTIYISQVWNDASDLTGVGGINWLNPAYQFFGCESALVQFDITVIATPAAPNATDAPALSGPEINICEGDAFADVLFSNLGIDEYVLYEGGIGEVLRIQNGDVLNVDDLEGSLSTFDRDNVGVYTFGLSKISSISSETSFSGCESPTLPFTIEVHATETEVPTITPSNAITDNDGSGDILYEICLSDHDPLATLTATTAYTPLASKEFLWYETDNNGNNEVFLFSSTGPTFDALGMGLADVGDGDIKYFEVTQRTDIDDAIDDFVGCESPPVFIEVQFSNLDALTVNMPTSTNPGLTNTYCYDHGDFAMTLREGGGAIADGDITNYEVRLTGTGTIIDVDPGVGVTLATGTGNPVADLDAWLIGGGGDTDLTGGASAVLDVYYEYTHPTLGCIGSHIETITISPDPDITFFVNGIDITAFVAGDDQFCYEDGNINIQGALADGTPLTTGTFVSSELGALTTSNGSASFNPTNEHNSFHGVTGTDGKFLNQSSINLTYNYTDANGCDNSVNVDLFVNPEPEVLEVTGLVASDLAFANATNLIRLTDFCEGSTAVTAEINLVEPLADDPINFPLVEATDEEDDYSGYTFAWTVGGSTITDLNLDGLENTIEFVPPNNTLNITVTVTDLNGCSEVFNEIHTLQELPSLDITGITDGDTFCADEPTDPTIGLADATVNGIPATSAYDADNVISWSVDSYLEGNAGSPVQILTGATSLPIVDLDAWHTAGALGGTLVGGVSSYHTITIVYQDTDREYQGIATMCTNTVQEQIVIHPDPHVSIEVNGVDINDPLLADEFCYDENDIVLQGVQYVYDLTGITDTINLNSGQFSSDQTGNLGTNIGQGVFNTVAQHDAFHGSSGKFLNQSTINITFDYTDDNTCDNTVNVNLFVNPEPEVLDVTGLSPSDLAAARGTNFIRLTDFCEGSTAVTAEIKLVEPFADDPINFPLVEATDEEDDYSGYTFTWTVGGSAATDLNLDGLDNTLEFVPSTPSFNIAVTVTDLNGCVEVFSEDHQLQILPSLNITGIDDVGNTSAVDQTSFCADETDPIIGLTDATLDGLSAAHTIAIGDIVSWSVDSYNETDGSGAAVQIASGAGSLPTVDLDAWHTDGALVTPGTLVGGNPTYHAVTIVYQDPSRDYQGNPTMCSNVVVETIVVNPDPDISVTLEGVDADNLQFCYDDINLSITGIDVASDLAINDGTLTIDGTPVSTNGSTVINAATYHGVDPFAPQSTHTIVYTYTDGQGCTNSVSRDFLVNPRPEFVGNVIQTASTCATSSVELFVDMTDGVGNYSFTWNVNGVDVNGVDVIDEDGNNNDERITYNFGGQLTANFGVTATYIGAAYTTNCVASIQNQSITVGAEPIPAISWVGITAGNADGTDFTITEDNATLPDGDVDLVELVIDGATELSVPNPVFPLNFNHDFVVSGDHTVDVIMNTSAGCDVTLNRTIRILPHYTGFNSTNSYSESFETAAAFDLTAAQGGWLIDSLSLDGKLYYDTATSWVRGSGASVPGTTANIDGTGAVYTAPGGVNGYRESEVSFVYSPSFDLSGFTAPTISFLRYEDFETFRDGAVFQVSVDDGRSWQTVGSYNPGLEAEGLASTPGWYNREGISSSPGSVAPGAATASNNPQVGWALNSDWQEAISPIEIDPAQNDFVRFRFALSAQAGEKTTNGFGFDLVRIYERNQIVLLELFSSTMSEESVIVNDTVDVRPQYAGSDILKINYFTDLRNTLPDGIDLINEKNSADPGAKVAFYGVGDVPSLSIGGDINFVDIDNMPYSSLNAKLSNARLSNPAFDIALNATVDGSGNLIVDADFTATTAFGDDAEMTLMVAVVEPTVTLPSNMGLYTAGSTVRNVLRTLLPSAAGQYETGPIAQGDVRSLSTITWPINNMFDVSNLRVIVYVQDLTTKQIYQAAFADVLTGLSNNVLGVDELPDFSVYPNPADKLVNVEFADGISEDTEWIIYDQAGREVFKGEISKGTKTLTVETADVPSGLYFLHLYAEERKLRAKRIMVVH